jgi:hypothetical protein
MSKFKDILVSLGLWVLGVLGYWIVELAGLEISLGRGWVMNGKWEVGLGSERLRAEMAGARSSSFHLCPDYCSICSPYQDRSLPNQCFRAPFYRARATVSTPLWRMRKIADDSHPPSLNAGTSASPTPARLFISTATPASRQQAPNFPIPIARSVIRTLIPSWHHLYGYGGASCSGSCIKLPSNVSLTAPVL